jgi:hypothetical protein
VATTPTQRGTSFARSLRMPDPVTDPDLDAPTLDIRESIGDDDGDDEEDDHNRRVLFEDNDEFGEADLVEDLDLEELMSAEVQPS